LQADSGVETVDPVRAALEELVSCHFSVIEHANPEEEARRSHARMAAAWKQALVALDKWPRPASAKASHSFTERPVPGIGAAEVCGKCGVIRHRRSKAVPWRYYAPDKSPLTAKPACGVDLPDGAQR
jgi:hypothetical protein